MSSFENNNPAFFSQGLKRKEFKSGRFIKSFNTMEWDTFGNYNIFGTLNRHSFSPSWLLLLDVPPKSLSQAYYRDFNFAIFQLLQEAICMTKSLY